jgi:methionyl-tRNA formyltransferase
MRFVLFGDGEWAARSLEALLAASHTCCGVVLRSVPSDDSLACAARREGIEPLCPRSINSSEAIQQVEATAPELGLSIAYNQIFRAAMIQLPARGIVNFHAGSLPLYRGRNVVNWAIINGETEIGLTAHYVDEGIDTGDILRQESLPIEWTDTYADVLARVVTRFPEFVTLVVSELESGASGKRPQPAGAGTYFTGRCGADEWLDWNDPSIRIYNKIRAITRPAPGARTILNSTEVRIWRASYEPAWPRYLAVPGSVVGRRPEGVLVKTGDSVVMVEEAQLEGQEPSTPKWPVGTRLGMNLLCEMERLAARVRALEEMVRNQAGS